jgi:hypothetical protein
LVTGAGDLVVVKTQKFGWCNDNIHEGCRIRFSFYEKDYQCACDCHSTKSLPPLVAGKNMWPIKPDKPEKQTRKNKS